MNKKLVALAVSAIAAGAASAQTANVTLYGVVDTYLVNVRTGSGKTSAGASVGGGSFTAVDAGGLSGSRWGLRGSEALGGGLNAVFTLENGFDSSNGALGQGGLLFGRQAFVGVTGGFGALTVGRQYAPIFYTGADADVDGYSNFSVVTNHMLLQDATSQLRINNAVNYKTPNMGGLTANLQWALGESTVSTSAGRTLGANLAYNNGPINAGVGYADRKSSTGASAARAVMLGGTFNAGVATIGADYWQWKNPSVANTTRKSWQIGASVPMGALSFVAQVGELKVDGGAKQMMFNLGANYALSKRTDTYFRFVNGSSNALMSMAIPGVGGVAGCSAGTPAAPAVCLDADTRAFAVGLRHRF